MKISGPIEALPEVQAFHLFQRFPLMKISGPIEASRAVHTAPDRSIFPLMKISGPIEATTGGSSPLSSHAISADENQRPH